MRRSSALMALISVLGSTINGVIFGRKEGSVTDLRDDLPDPVELMVEESDRSVAEEHLLKRWRAWSESKAAHAQTQALNFKGETLLVDKGTAVLMAYSSLTAQVPRKSTIRLHQWRVGGCGGEDVDPAVEEEIDAGEHGAAVQGDQTKDESGHENSSENVNDSLDANLDGDGCVLRVRFASRAKAGSNGSVQVTGNIASAANDGIGLHLGAQLAASAGTTLAKVTPPPWISAATYFTALPVGPMVSDSGFGVFLETAPDTVRLQYVHSHDMRTRGGPAYVLEWSESRLRSRGYIALEVSVMPAECAIKTGNAGSGHKSNNGPVGTVSLNTLGCIDTAHFQHIRVVAPSHYVRSSHAAGHAKRSEGGWTRMRAYFLPPSPVHPANGTHTYAYTFRFSTATTSVASQFGTGSGSAIDDLGAGRACDADLSGEAVLLTGISVRPARTRAEALAAIRSTRRRTAIEAAGTAALGRSAVRFYDANGTRSPLHQRGLPTCSSAMHHYHCNGGHANSSLGCTFIRGSDRSSVFVLTHPEARQPADRQSLAGAIVVKYNALCDWGNLEPRYCSAKARARAAAQGVSGRDGCNRAFSRWYHAEALVTQAMYALTMPYIASDGQVYDAATPHSAGFFSAAACAGAPPRAWVSPRSEGLRQIFGDTIDTIALPRGYADFGDMLTRRWRQRTAVEAQQEEGRSCCRGEPCRAPSSAVATSYIPDAKGPCERWGVAFARGLLFQMLFMLTTMHDAFLVAQMDASLSHFRFARDAVGALSWSRWLRWRHAKRRAARKAETAKQAVPPPVDLWRYQQLNRTYWLPAHHVRGYTVLQFDYNYVKYFGHDNSWPPPHRAYDCDATPYCENEWECSDRWDYKWCFDKDKHDHDEKVRSGKYKPGVGFPSRNHLVYAEMDHIQDMVRHIREHKLRDVKNRGRHDRVVMARAHAHLKNMEDCMRELRCSARQLIEEHDFFAPLRESHHDHDAAGRRIVRRYGYRHIADLHRTIGRTTAFNLSSCMPATGAD